MTEEQPIEGIQVIKLTGQVDLPEDPDPRYPYRLEARLRAPSMLGVTFALLYGGQEVIVLRGVSLAAVEAAVTHLELRGHARLQWLTISGPEGVIETVGTPPTRSSR